MNKIIPLAKDPLSAIELLINQDPHLVSPNTKRQYRADLANFEEWRGEREITKTLIEAYAAELQGGGYAPATINQRLAAIRWYSRKIVDIATDYLQDPELAARAARVALVEDVKGDTQEAGRYIESGELSALIGACQSDPNRAAGIRDAAIIALAWTTGLRRESICRIKVSDLTPRDAGFDLAYTGKGNKHGKAFIDDGAYTVLTDWLRIRGNQPGQVFCPVNKSGKVAPTGKLSGEALRKLLLKREMQAGIEHLTWHDYRRTFATNLWNANIDGVTIQRLMLHYNQNQTARYNRAPEKLQRIAVRVLHVPYKSKI
jgi:integrase